MDCVIYNIGDRNSSTSSTARVIQFLLKLSFAFAAHRIQGHTIKKPLTVVVDFYKAHNEAKVYVLLSRAHDPSTYLLKCLLKY